jgi:hypothetical protein
METIELSRKQLYDIVWSTSLSKLTQEYAFSNEGIKKICKQFDIPMPDNGYWIKLKFNKPVQKVKLNPNFGGVDKIVFTIREAGNSVNVDQTPLTIRTKEIENDPHAPLIVPDKISKPDILTLQTKEYWRESKGSVFYDKYIKLRYPIRVSVKDRERALRFMDTFAKLLRYRGHTIAKEHRDTCVLIDSIYIQFDLREATKRVPSTEKWRTADYVPTGEFIFKVGRYSREKEWRDGKVKLEALLARIVAKLELYAQDEKDQNERTHLWRLKLEEEKRIKEEIKKRKDDESAKFIKLLDLSKQYNNSLLIRQYIEVEKQKAIKTNSLTQEVQEWIKWASDKADWYDPTINKPDDILDAQ